MQHIGLQRETEQGKKLADFEPNGIDLRIVRDAPETSVCLRFIDPYGDTIFNQIQMPVLIDELRGLAALSPDAGFCEHVARVVAFIRVSIETHVYVRFVGD